MVLETIDLGIKGLNKLFKNKGVRHPTSLLVTGIPGTGKTVFALEFIYRGAEKNEPGIFIAYEEDADAIRELAVSLGMKKFSDFEKRNLITIIEQPASLSNISSIRIPYQQIKRYHVKRLALDSLTLFEYVYSPEPLKLRKGIVKFLQSMKLEGVTVLATAEKRTASLGNFTYDTQDFLFDGIVAMHHNRKGSTYERLLQIVKMRRQEHATNIVPFAVSSSGMEVYPDQIPFSLADK